MPEARQKTDGGRPIVDAIWPDTRLIVFDRGAQRGRFIAVGDLYRLASSNIAAWRAILTEWREQAVAALGAKADRPTKINRDIPINGVHPPGKRSIDIAQAGVVAGDIIMVRARVALPAQVFLVSAWSGLDGQVTLEFLITAQVTLPAGTVAAITLTTLR